MGPLDVACHFSVGEHNARVEGIQTWWWVLFMSETLAGMRVCVLDCCGDKDQKNETLDTSSQSGLIFTERMRNCDIWKKPKVEPLHLCTEGGQLRLLEFLISISAGWLPVQTMGLTLKGIAYPIWPWNALGTPGGGCGWRKGCLGYVVQHADTTTWTCAVHYNICSWKVI